MNEIPTDIGGEIVEILVDNAQAVEYNQPLFKIRPSS
jgi:biotin carboxyl carrier protein